MCSQRNMMHDYLYCLWFIASESDSAQEQTLGLQNPRPSFTVPSPSLGFPYSSFPLKERYANVLRLKVQTANMTFNDARCGANNLSWARWGGRRCCRCHGRIRSESELEELVSGRKHFTDLLRLIGGHSKTDWIAANVNSYAVHLLKKYKFE